MSTSSGTVGLAGVRRRRRVLWVCAVLVTVVALVVGGTWLAAMSGERESPQVSCAAEIVFEDRTYAGYGDPLRVPRRGERIGVATTPVCPDGERSGGEELDVWSLPGVDPSVAVMADGVVWVEGRESALPQRLGELTEPVACSSPGPSTVTGRLVSVDEPPTGGDFRPRPPYEAIVVADGGSSLPLSEYSSVTIEVQVTPTTQGGSDADLVATALQDGDHLDIAVRCSAGAFMATSWRPAS